MVRVVGLLQRDHGATLTVLIAATDWLPHTTRAALTGLRKRRPRRDARPVRQGAGIELPHPAGSQCRGRER
jgi:hypothetical protein